MKSIHVLAKELGLTSRTLRHWEAEGLFSSRRDQKSGWRFYDVDAEFSVRIVRLLRRLEIPISQIYSVIDNRRNDQIIALIQRQLVILRSNGETLEEKKQLLNSMLDFLTSVGTVQIDFDIIEQYDDFLDKSLLLVSQRDSDTKNIYYVTLPPMRVVYHITVGVAPEDEAMEPVLQWLTSSGLLGTARLFGGNMPPMPVKSGESYGYGMCASIPNDIIVPKHLKEMILPGGLYARMESGDDISSSWKYLIKSIKSENKYVSDRSRLCLEEHTRNASLEGKGNDYLLTLFEPVK